MEGTECSRSATTAASHRSQRDSEGVQGTQYGSTMVEPRGEAFGGRAAQERAAGPQNSGMTEMRQEAQKSSTRPEDGEMELESSWSDLTPANRANMEQLRRQMMPAVPEKRFLGMNRITDEEGDVETRQWSPVPLGGFETNASHGASNGSQPGESKNTMDSSAFWGFDEPDQKPVLRTERILQVGQSPQQQPNHHSPEALIGRLQKRASEGDDDALATLKMMDSLHGQHSMPAHTSRIPAHTSPPVNRSVWTNAGDRSPEKMFETSSATHLALAQLASQGDTTALSALRMLEAIRLTEMHSNPMGGKLSHPDSSEKVPAPRRIDTVKVMVKAIDLSTPEASENSLYTFSSTCRAVGIPRSGLRTLHQRKRHSRYWSTSGRLAARRSRLRCAERLAMEVQVRQCWST